MQHVFSGLPAAPGIGVGTLYIYDPMPLRKQLFAPVTPPSTPGETRTAATTASVRP
ncbi:MAG: hypothetical protein R2856_29720 [Caldilineaceae bacterium]